MEKILYLIPVQISDNSTEVQHHLWVSSGLFDQVQTLFVENQRSARRFLRKAGYQGDLDRQHWIVLDRDCQLEDLLTALKGITDDAPGALLSEAGMPGVADPGSEVVALAHQLRVRVVPLPGISSIFMALAASGMNGQHFTFHGYLPVNESDRNRKIRQLEQIALQTGYTQIFMETPYRNIPMLKSLLKVLHENTRLCVAADITGDNEMIKTLPVSVWLKMKPVIHKLPSIFLVNV